MLVFSLPKKSCRGCLWRPRNNCLERCHSPNRQGTSNSSAEHILVPSSHCVVHKNAEQCTRLPSMIFLCRTQVCESRGMIGFWIGLVHCGLRRHESLGVPPSKPWISARVVALGSSERKGQQLVAIVDAFDWRLGLSSFGFWKTWQKNCWRERLHHRWGQSRQEEISSRMAYFLVAELSQHCRELRSVGGDGQGEGEDIKTHDVRTTLRAGCWVSRRRAILILLLIMSALVHGQVEHDSKTCIDKLRFVACCRSRNGCQGCWWGKSWMSKGVGCRKVWKAFKVIEAQK